MSPPGGRRFGPEVSRVLFVKNLPFKTTGEDCYKIFGRFGSIRQVRLGVGAKTKGTAFVVFDDIQHAKAAVESLTGFNVDGRYLVVLYFHVRSEAAARGWGPRVNWRAPPPRRQPSKKIQQETVEKQRVEVEKLRDQYKILDA
jgi:pre-mRNA branch site protein p14